MFVKWPHTENITTAERMNDQDYLNAPSIEGGWAITEKIDGTNISLSFYPDGRMEVSKRNSTLGEGASFYNVFNNLHLVDKLIEFMKTEFMWMPDYEQVNFHGEYFGPRILNRVYYGSGYQFRFFAMTVIAKDLDMPAFIPCDLMREMFDKYGMGELLVPLLAVVDTFEEAIAYKNDGVTTFHDEKHNDTMEGIVITPFTVPAVGHDGNFLFKSKSDKFSEKMAAKRVRVTDDGQIETRKKVNAKFLEYCTKSRMYSVFSKLGSPESLKEAGRYLAEFINDAKEDFLRENPEYKDLSKGELKSVTNIGSLGFNLFCTVKGEMNS